MHEPSVETPENPSRVEPGYVEKLFGPKVDSAPAPELICEVVGEVVELSQAAPEAVAAVAFAVVAAALGPKVLLAQGRSRQPLALNVIVAHRSPRTLPWMDALMAPFTGRAFEMEADLMKQGTAGIKADIANREKELAQARRTIAPNPESLAQLQTEAERAPSRLKPFVATSSVALKELGCLLPRCFDGGITMVSAGNDPGADLMRLKAPERAHLAELLNRSWTGTPLAFADHVYTGSISLVWQTRRSIKEQLGPRGFDPAWVSVPTLFLNDASNGKALPEFAHEAAWQRLLTSLFEHRCLHREAVFTLSAEARSVLATFGEHVAASLDNVPAALRPHLGWLPELAARLSAIFWILGDHDDLVIDETTASEAVETTRWLGRQHLLALAVSAPADSAAGADRVAQMLTKIRVKQPLTRRELWVSFDHPKAAWFEPALAALLSSKAVAYNDREQLITP